MSLLAKLAVAVMGMSLAVSDPLIPAEFERMPKVLPGPVTARVVRVVDGDTIVVRASPWLGMEIETSVRLAGIDAPELAGRCEDEKAQAIAARELLLTAIGDGWILLREVQLGKYAGRVVAVVETADGLDVARLLLESGLARAYDGRRRESWCD